MTRTVDAAAFRRAQAYGAALTNHVLSLIEITRRLGSPSAATLIKACEHAIRDAYQAGEAAALAQKAGSEQADRPQGAGFDPATDDPRLTGWQR